MPDVWTPLKLRSANEGIIFEGEASGAGSTPEQAIYTGSVTNVASNASASLPWTVVSGDILLDLTTPESPTVLADGLYAITTETFGFADADGNLQVTLTTGGNTWSGQCPNTGYGAVTLSATYKLSAGDALVLVVQNFGADVLANVGMNACVVKL